MSLSESELRELVTILEELAPHERRESLLRFVADSFPSYQAGWVHRDVCERLERFSQAVERGESPRLMLYLPPRHGKSMIASERFPVWHLGRRPDHQIVVAAYGMTLAAKFSKRARAVARMPITGEAFPELVLDPERQAVEEWETTDAGGYKAVGVGGGLTGSGCHILIIDDPVKDAEQADSEVYREKVWEWYTSTAYTRLMPGGGVLVIMTRWSEDDLAGRLLKAQDEGGDRWEVITYPAIAEEDEPMRRQGEALHPERFNVERLDKIRRAVGPRVWTALYQQRPSSAEGNMLKRDRWRFYSVPPAGFDYVIQSWDCSFKDSDGSDFVVGQVWGRAGGRFYLLHQVRARMGFADTKLAIKNVRRLFPAATAIFIEDAANGTAIIEELSVEIPGIVAVKPLGGKIARAQAAQPYLDAGNCYLPEGEVFTAEFVEEAAAFPRGKHDDMVDAWSQAMAQLGRYEEWEPEGVSF